MATRYALRATHKLIKLDPWFITGFTDAEGCFLVSIIKDKEYRLGWSVSPKYHINLHQKDKAILEQIKKFFLVGALISMDLSQ
jgi:hypothetical protein